jgi:hypothetical protein
MPLENKRKYSLLNLKYIMIKMIMCFGVVLYQNTTLVFK